MSEKIKDVGPLKDKATDLWENRRKFVSRGFIGGITALSGTASITRGVTELVIYHPREVATSPKHLQEVPEAIEESVDFIVENAPDTPSHLISAAKRTKGELEEMDIEKIEYVGENGEIHETWGANIPFVEGDDCIEADDKQYCYNPEDERFHYTEEVSNTQDSDTNTDTNRPSKAIAKEVKRISSGGILLGAGAALALVKNKNHELTRRKFVERSVKGIQYGVIWTAISSQPVKDKLPDLPGQ